MQKQSNYHLFAEVSPLMAAPSNDYYALIHNDILTYIIPLEVLKPWICIATMRKFEITT